jgi:rhomboid protease GluP
VLVGVNDDTCYNCGRRNPGLWGYAPALRRLGQDLGFVNFFMAAAIALYVLSLLLSRSGLQGMLAPDPRILILLGASGAVPVFELGQWWSVFTAGWLHGNVLHLLFNILWIRQLAPSIAELYGAGRMVVIYTTAGVAGFTLSSLAGEYLQWIPLPFLRGAGLTVGASAAIFGLFGAAVYYGRRSGSSVVGQMGVQYAVLLGIFGLLSPGTDNYAHLGGFLGGYAIARYLDPLKPERVDHIVAAIVCIAIAFVAMVASVVRVLPYLLQ